MTRDIAQDRQTDQGSRLAEGWTLLRGGDHKGALAIANELTETSDASAEALLFAGEVHFALGNFKGTEALADRAIRAFPEDIGAGVLRCRALMALGRPADARDIALELAKRKVDDESHVDILVTVLSGLAEPAAAQPLCERSVERHPTSMRAQRRMALNSRLVGRFDDARKAANAVLRQNPHDYEMIGLRSAVSTATPNENHIEAMESLLEAGCSSAFGAARVAYALAKENEELGNHERAFRYIDAGAQFKKHTFGNYKVDRDLEILGEIEGTFTAARFADDDKAGHDSEEPVFILGLPRTGSSLLERILSSHADIHAAGELMHFNSAMVAELQRIGAPRDPRQQLESVFDCDPVAIGRDYIEKTRPFTGHTKHFIDKRPLNFLLIGMIARSLPRARIIHVRRTPMDACFAIYKFLFNDAYPWSYDLDDIARYYIAYRRLMDHWRRVLPDRIIDVAYEDVIEDIEGQTRELLDKLDLDWDPACLRFYENQAAAMTGSAAQVRKKLYSSSVDRWRSHEEALKFVAFAIESAGFDPYAP